MSTHADIVVERRDGSVKMVYLHFDGYPSNVVPILRDHYTTQELAEALVEPGDMSSLDIMCDKPAGHSYARPAKDHTVYYGRDRGEEDTEGTIFPDLTSVKRQQGYSYLWKREGGWFAMDRDGGLMPLSEGVPED